MKNTQLRENYSIQLHVEGAKSYVKKLSHLIELMRKGETKPENLFVSFDVM